jgi:serine/threonine protein kinase
MGDYKDLYRLEAKPLGRGGQAEVFRADSRRTGDIVALKRRISTSAVAIDRMRREIDVQSKLQHHNVMPIVDFDTDDFSWFTMPVATESLGARTLPLAVDELKRVLLDVATGLQAAHSSGLVHRDVKPHNVLRLNDQHGERWVIADWGVVRRPIGETTAHHTRAGDTIGTDGFAPPESYVDSHEATAAWDVYSLGRVAAWGSSGIVPTPNVDLAAPEPWRRFVRVLTDNDVNRRPQDMSRVIELLQLVDTVPATVAGVSNETLQRAKDGDTNAAVQVLAAAGDYLDDGAFFIDELAHVLGTGLQEFVSNEPAAVRTLVLRMEYHLEHESWRNRSFDHYNVPLHWIQGVAEAAIAMNNFDLMEDAAAALFRQDSRLDRYRQKDQSRQWLASLTGESARRIAQLLRENRQAAAYYGELKSAADADLRAALRQAQSG